MSGGFGKQDEQVKVTIIETQFVKTDEANFKYVVHQFTGKDTEVPTVSRPSLVKPQEQRAMPIMAQSQMGVGNGSRSSEASWKQDGAMVDREAAFMVDLEPFWEDMHKFIN